MGLQRLDRCGDSLRVGGQVLTFRPIGILCQARVPPGHVLLLPLQHDRGPHQGRHQLNGQLRICGSPRIVDGEISSLRPGSTHSRTHGRAGDLYDDEERLR